MFASRRILYSLVGTLLCLAALLAACGSQSPVPDESPSPTRAEDTNATADTATPTDAPPATEFTSPLEHEVSPLPVPPDGRETDEQSTGPVEILPPGQDPEPAPLTGEVPQDLLDAVFDDLAERLGPSREAITVEESGAVVWRDGSLGCPQPGMMYTQALVPGYRIILTAGEETFDYHASERGHFLLCDAGLAEEGLPPGSGGDPLVDQ